MMQWIGSKYHTTVHHTHYIYNYGQVFLFCDWFWGTLQIPNGPTSVDTKKKNKAA
jgi:sterol desaturase/sphingolipid hydroxylase (fatty acid hydroxylase superfamily)